jgi:hypothetical protein
MIWEELGIKDDSSDVNANTVEGKENVKGCDAYAKASFVGSGSSICSNHGSFNNEASAASNHSNEQ